MKRKIILTLIALLTLCIAIGAVSAWEFSFGGESSSSSTVGTDGSASVDYNNGKLTINGIEFAIPDGYTQDTNATVTGENTGNNDGTKISSATFHNGDKTIVVKVIYADSKLENFTPSTSNSVNKTIDNKNGVLETIDNQTVFSVLEDGKLIQITSPDEATLSGIIK